jgi:hypothetical protein
VRHKASLSYVVRLCLETKKKRETDREKGRKEEKREEKREVRKKKKERERKKEASSWRCVKRQRESLPGTC